MGRKRVALTIDENIFEKFQETVVDYGYSRATVSLLVQKFMADTLRDIEKHGTSPALELFGYEEKQPDISNT
ncbi:MAG: hypothetical protein QM483_00605 [Desulfuromusa sp.]